MYFPMESENPTASGQARAGENKEGLKMLGRQPYS